jgi:hypothetical protein
MAQSKADTETARILGISRTHSVLLRKVDDSQGGCPQLVLSRPEEVLGAKATILLAFWLYIDSMTAAAWSAAGEAAGEAALDAAWSAAWNAAWSAAWNAAWSAAWNAAWSAAGEAAGSAALASSEIQGMDLLEAQGRQPYFLAVFGFDTWDKVRALVVGEKEGPDANPS